jgi:medium-chain acyl-[acyl-carrier-protein] hydrolase
MISEDRQMASNNSWITFPRPNPKSNLRLFCFPYAGAGGSIYRSWSDLLAPAVDVYSIQLPGRGSRLKEPLMTDLPPLIQILSQAIQPYLDCPYAFFGHSLGAIISYEVAHQLRQQDQPLPTHLFVSGRRAPQISRPIFPTHLLPDSELIEELRNYGGTPQLALDSSELMQLFLPVLRADLSLDEEYIYTPQGALDCSISAFGGIEDRKATYEDLAGWQAQTKQTFNLRLFPGGHFFLNSNLYDILKAVTKDLCSWAPRKID